MNGGTVSNNVIVNWNKHPELQPAGDNPFPGDFAQPLVTRFSSNVTTAGNITQASSTLQGPLSLNPSSASVSADGSANSFAVQANVPNFAWIAVPVSLTVGTAKSQSLVTLAVQ